MQSPPSPLLRVGIIGASPSRGWARESHVPAIRYLAGLEISAVATSSAETARVAAEAFGARNAYSDGFQLMRSNEVDIVSICVRVPQHRELVLAAIEAGKHVYCEWPLGRNLAEAEEMCGAAERSAVHVAIGFQGRQNPAVRQARAVIESGVMGRLLTARVFSSSAGFASELARDYAYLNDGINGAHLSTILGGHTLDLAISLLGEVRSVEALAATQFEQIKLTDTGEIITRNVPDYLSILAHHASGCVLSAVVDGTRPPGTPFSFEIVGTNGRIELTGGHPAGFQAGRLKLKGDFAPDLPQAAAPDALPDPAVNIAEVYARLAADIRDNTRTVSDFSEAVRITRLISTALKAAETGIRQSAG